MDRDEYRRGKRLMIAVYYEGPWERVSAFFLGIHRDNRDELRWEIPENPRGWRWLFGEIADWADRRNYAWRNRIVSKGKMPRERWKRRRP
jgi:hypothetical protein